MKENIFSSSTKKVLELNNLDSGTKIECKNFFSNKKINEIVDKIFNLLQNQDIQVKFKKNKSLNFVFVFDGIEFTVNPGMTTELIKEQYDYERIRLQDQKNMADAKFFKSNKSI